MFDIELIERNAETKDGKKGEKDALKQLKKMEEISQYSLSELIDKVYKRTTNGEYIEGYCSVIRQVLATITVAA